MSDISPELIAQFDQARAAGESLAETEPRAVRGCLKSPTVVMISPRSP